MWIKYFDYEYCIDRDELYLMAKMEDEVSFLLPVGVLPMENAIQELRIYCDAMGISCKLVVVPEDALPLLRPFISKIFNTPQWNDYLYEASQMMSYDGHNLKDKRNRARKFETSYKFSYELLMGTNLAEAQTFLTIFVNDYESGKDMLAIYENQETEYVLLHYSWMPFVGLVVRVDANIQGMIIGEIVNDTLFIHIEKSMKKYNGINEALFRAFVTRILIENDGIVYVNREEDMDDEGLRRSKLSYAPCRILKKYTVVL